MTSTLPEGNSVAVWLPRAVARAPVGLQAPVTGSSSPVSGIPAPVGKPAPGGSVDIPAIPETPAPASKK